MRLTDDPEYGPPSRFGDTHIYYVLTLLDESRPTSRMKLSEMTGIGEGSIRNIVGILKKWKAVEIRQTGIRISESGLKLRDSIPVKLVDVERFEYVMGAYHQGVLAKGVADKITNGMYQRDRGIIAGANGASVFMIREGRLIMPTNWDMDTRDPEFARHLRSKGMEEGDVMIISGASDVRVAAVSAISIALDLL
ncbi:MAG: hypothetical protein LBU30_02600 [Candidatus Methanoplasma sp.]|jgi:hypothetical protein|nr:hypothetical protein [Candidatus Methanoplasma sp.]